MMRNNTIGASVRCESIAADSSSVGIAGGEATPFRRRVRRWFFHCAMRALTLVHCIALTVARCVGRRRRVRSKGSGLNILLTGRLDSDNWIVAHLGPLAKSKECSGVWMVSTNPVPHLDKVTGIYPPRWMVKILGVTPARLLTFIWIAIRMRPDIVGGFHMLINGMVAAVTGHLTGARTMYFCVGGPAEVLDGGVWGEGNYFAKMETPDPVVERRLLKTVSAFDAVITMGTRTVEFFKEKGVDTAFGVVSGGIDSSKYSPTGAAPQIDIVTTGRLVEIKRIDIFLEAVKYASRRIPEIRAVVVGDGPLREALVQTARNLGIGNCVRFVGHQENVAQWLGKSKIFVLTSDSEALSLSAIEAMMCGLPAVVSDVGDMVDLIAHGVNGYLLPRRAPRVFADCIVELLQDERKLEAFSRAGRFSAMRYEKTRATQQWDEILANQG
ncbi:MAG: glycosyltransferase family 4 protein [Planctomycetota bacterium]|jgi:glycosyltransferase involved in cell wall biosynthesis